MKPIIIFFSIFTVYSIASYLYFNKNNQIEINNSQVYEDPTIASISKRTTAAETGTIDIVNELNNKLQKINKNKDQITQPTESGVDYSNIDVSKSIGSQIVSYMKEKDESEKKDWIYILMAGVLQSLPSTVIYAALAWVISSLLKKSKTREVTINNIDLYFYKYTSQKNKDSNTISFKRSFKFGKLQWETSGNLKFN